MRILSCLTLAAAFAIPTVAHADNIAGAGATFPYPLYAKWAEAYRAETGIGVNYQSIGSGGGIKQIKAKTVDFGASDMPLKPEVLDMAGLMQWPMVIGGVVPVVNVPGIKPGDLKLTGAVLADIYLGKVAKWNDPAIAALNPSLALPDQAIAPVHRSDGSGTSFIFTDYLAKASPTWKDSVGVSTAVEWPTGLGGKGNEGVAAMTGQTVGAIGYVEYAYALQNKMTYAQMQNAAGQFVTPDGASFQAAAANADWANAPGFHLVLTNPPGADSWPITGASFILMHKTQDEPETAKRVLAFFDWAYRKGDQMAEQLHYVPIPGKVVAVVEASWAKNMSDKDGKPVWTK